MAPTVHHTITLLLSLLSTLLLLTTAVTATARGFSLELIPPFSERSPFYPGNLTSSQRLQWLIQSSATHARRLESTILGPNTTALRPPLQESQYDYVVSVDIGTGAGRKPQLLRIDSGSSLTWIQCKPCSPCFPGPQFSSSDSPTYRSLRARDSRCVHPYGPGPDRRCVYHITYDDRTSTSGVLSTETFTFQSDRSGRPEPFADLTFGCSKSSNFPPRKSEWPWTGIMGMGTSPESIVTKLSGETGRFSYCLVRPSSRASSFMRFGDDCQMSRRLQRMELIIFPDISHYYLRLNDVSIGGHRFHFPAGYFERRRDRTSGCILDTGSTVSHLIKPAYDRVSEYLTEHFIRHHIHRIRASECNPGIEHCFTLPDGNFVDLLPSMTFHFMGADLQIGWKSTYLVKKRKSCFCFMVAPHDLFTILGAYQQADTRFVFDVKNRALWFEHENCADDGHHS